MAKFPKADGAWSGLLLGREKQEVAEKLKAKGAPRACEVCGTASWTLGDYIVSPTGVARVDGGGFRDASRDPYHPSLLLFCDNCGNTKFINPLILGLDLSIGNPDD